MAVDGKARSIARENPLPGVYVTPIVYPRTITASSTTTVLLNWPKDTKAIYLGWVNVSTNNGNPFTSWPTLGGVTMASILDMSAAQNTRHGFGHWMTLATMTSKKLIMTIGSSTTRVWVAALTAQSKIVYVTYSSAGTSGTLATPDTSAYDPATAVITAHYKLGAIYATTGVGIVDYGDSGTGFMGASITDLYGQKTCTFTGGVNASVCITTYRDTSVLGA